MRMLNDSEKKFIELSKKILAEIREKRPVVHVISNVVTLEPVADIILATGAIPIAAYAPEEVEEVVSRADALLLNTGTPTELRRKSYILAGKRAKSKGIPVILDPVGVGISKFRIDIVDEILEAISPQVIRMNRAEAEFLIRRSSSHLRGVDAMGAMITDNELKEFAREQKSILVVTGEKNIVTDGGGIFTTEIGNPLMKFETGAGCMLDGIIASFASIKIFPEFETVSAALTIFNYLSLLSDPKNLKRDIIHRVKNLDAISP